MQVSEIASIGRAVVTYHTGGQSQGGSGIPLEARTHIGIRSLASLGP